MKKNIFSLRVFCAAVLAAALGAGVNASAQIITNAYDLGTNYVAAGNFFTGDNQGFGFGPWTVTAGGGGQVLTNEDNAQNGNYAFSITNQTANGLTTANRPFSNALPVGGSFSVRFRLNHLDANATNGLQLQDAAGNVLFSFYHHSGDNNNGWFTDANGTGVATNFTYNFQGFSSLTFTLNNATNYTFKDNGPGTGSFGGTISNAAITQVTFYRANSNSITFDGENFDFNALTITTLGSKPVFDVQPKNSAAIAGGTITLNAHATSNLGDPNYQWYFTNGPISGATATNLILSNVDATNAGNYYVVAANTAGNVTSAVVTVTVIPFGYTNAYDVVANYSGQISGNQGFGFGPWSVSTIGGGQYIDSLFAIWNGTGGDASTAVRPFNSPLPVGGSFLVQLQMNSLNSPTNLNVLELQDASGNVLFSYWHQGGDPELGDGHYSDAGVASGTATNFWYHNGQVDSFAFTLTSGTTYKFTDLASGANLTGTLSGAPITQVTFLRTNGFLQYSGGGQDFKFNGLTILSPNGNPPQFTAQPQYNGGLLGSTINLNGTATSGTGAVSYQWYFGGVAITDATNATLALGNASLTNSGSYFLVANNSFGSVTSRVSVVTVYVDPSRLLTYEGFDYAGGFSAIDGTSQAGGLGWSGAWLNVGGVNNYINDGSLAGGANVPAGYDPLSTGNSYYNFDQSRAGRWLDCSTNGALAARGYLDANGNIGAAGKTLYVSFMMQPDITSKFYEFEFHRADLNDPGRIAGIGNDTADNDVHFRAPNGAFTDLGAGDSLEDPSVGNHAVDFYVVRIDFHGGNDDVRVYRNPTSLTEPLTPTVAVTNVGNMSFNGISLGAYGNYLAVDEIRLGATWSDALGMPGSNNMMQPVRQGNSWNILFTGNPTFTYRVQRATSLTSGDWTDLGTTTPLENGIGTVNDPNPPAGEAFYRTVTP